MRRLALVTFGVLALATAALGAACTLNPQPLPPIEANPATVPDASAEAGSKDNETATPDPLDGGTGATQDASRTDEGGSDGGDGGDGGDAGPDAGDGGACDGSACDGGDDSN